MPESTGLTCRLRWLGVAVVDPSSPRLDDPDLALTSGYQLPARLPC